jgi:hypothetical protein
MSTSEFSRESGADVADPCKNLVFRSHAHFAVFIKMPSEKMTPVFAFRWHLWGPDGEKQVPKLTSM